METENTAAQPQKLTHDELREESKRLCAQMTALLHGLHPGALAYAKRAGYLRWRHGFYKIERHADRSSVAGRGELVLVRHEMARDLDEEKRFSRLPPCLILSRWVERDGMAQVHAHIRPGVE